MAAHDLDGPVPPSAGGVLAAFDKAAEARFDRLRGQRVPDLAALVLSNLADYGAVWVLLALLKARRAGPPRHRAVAALACSGMASYGVNRVVKTLVGRTRPEGVGREEADGSLWVRPPSSSSFPSGHTLAAFSTAVVLGEQPSEVAAYLGFASAVAVSRVHLHAHHASDVVGGAAIGTALGLGARRLVGRLSGRSG